MAAKTFCPIMTIGFDPPKEGERDLRLCMKDCTWYDVSENRCQLSIIADNIKELENHVNDIAEYTADLAMVKTMEDQYDDYFGDDPEARAYYSGTR